MTNRNKRGRRLFANKLHQDLFFLVFFAAVVPCLITAISLFYLFFNITADQIGIPEAIAYNVVPAARRVINILSIVLPIVVIIILFFTYDVTHKLLGPYHRILRELDEIISGQRRGPIIIRKKDKFKVLVEKINRLLGQDRLE